MVVTPKLLMRISCFFMGLLLVPVSSARPDEYQGVTGTVVAEVQDIGIVVERAQLERGERIHRCPYCGEFIDVGVIHSHAEDKVKEMLEEALAARHAGYKQGKDKGPYLEVLIYRYQERQGGNFAVAQSADVGFHVHLMEGNTLKRLFVFEKEQAPLSQNPTGIKRFAERDAEWVTVDELAKEGVNDAVERLKDDLP